MKQKTYEGGKFFYEGDSTPTRPLKGERARRVWNYDYCKINLGPKKSTTKEKKTKACENRKGREILLIPSGRPVCGPMEDARKQMLAGQAVGP